MLRAPGRSARACIENRSGPAHSASAFTIGHAVRSGRPSLPGPATRRSRPSRPPSAGCRWDGGRAGGWGECKSLLLCPRPRAARALGREFARPFRPTTPHPLRAGRWRYRVCGRRGIDARDRMEMRSRCYGRRKPRTSGGASASAAILAIRLNGHPGDLARIPPSVFMTGSSPTDGRHARFIPSRTAPADRQPGAGPGRCPGRLTGATIAAGQSPLTAATRRRGDYPGAGRICRAGAGFTYPSRPGPAVPRRTAPAVAPGAIVPRRWSPAPRPASTTDPAALRRRHPPQPGDRSGPGLVVAPGLRRRPGSPSPTRDGDSRRARADRGVRQRAAPRWSRPAKPSMRGNTALRRARL